LPDSLFYDPIWVILEGLRLENVYIFGIFLRTFGIFYDRIGYLIFGFNLVHFSIFGIMFNENLAILLLIVLPTYVQANNYEVGFWWAMTLPGFRAA
jgi:hypothetical protein